MKIMCKASVQTNSSRKTRKCKNSAKRNGLCSLHLQREELDVAETLLTLSKESQITEDSMSNEYLDSNNTYTHSLSNYTDVINSMERDFNNSMEYLNVQFHELKSNLTLTELDKMEVLFTGYFEKYEDYNNNLKNDIKTQLEYYENIVEKLYNDKKILESHIQYRKEQCEEMKRLITYARERLLNLHDLLTL